MIVSSSSPRSRNAERGGVLLLSETSRYDGVMSWVVDWCFEIRSCVMDGRRFTSLSKPPFGLGGVLSQRYQNIL